MCSDNLTGIKEAINTAFPNTIQQRCIVHMIRNSIKFISYKDLALVQIYRELYKWLNRRSQKKSYTEETFKQVIEIFDLPKP